MKLDSEQFNNLKDLIEIQGSLPDTHVEVEKPKEISVSLEAISTEDELPCLKCETPPDVTKLSTDVLEQEQFNSIKELKEIHENISNSRIEFRKLEDATKEYMVVREKEAEDRVIKVLKESSKALEEISQNHTQLVSFKNELKAYAIELNGFTTDITTLFQDFNIRMKEAEKDMDVYHKEINIILIKTGTERIQITEDRKTLSRERQKTEDNTKLLASRQESLHRAWEELKKLK